MTTPRTTRGPIVRVVLGSLLADQPASRHHRLVRRAEPARCPGRATAAAASSTPPTPDCSTTSAPPALRRWPSPMSYTQYAREARYPRTDRTIPMAAQPPSAGGGSRPCDRGEHSATRQRSTSSPPGSETRHDHHRTNNAHRHRPRSLGTACRPPGPPRRPPAPRRTRRWQSPETVETSVRRILLCWCSSLPAPDRCWPVPPQPVSKAGRRPPGGLGLDAGMLFAPGAGLVALVMPRPSVRLVRRRAARAHSRSGSSVECHDSITALSRADPTLPIDCLMSIRPQAARKILAVYSLPWMLSC
jgi:hypothetical protein